MKQQQQMRSTRMGWVLVTIAVLMTLMVAPAQSEPAEYQTTSLALARGRVPLPGVADVYPDDTHCLELAYEAWNEAQGVEEETTEMVRGETEGRGFGFTCYRLTSDTPRDQLLLDVAAALRENGYEITADVGAGGAFFQEWIAEDVSDPVALRYVFQPDATLIAVGIELPETRRKHAINGYLGRVALNAHYAVESGEVALDEVLRDCTAEFPEYAWLSNAPVHAPAGLISCLVEFESLESGSIRVHVTATDDELGTLESEYP